jgi:FMN phosphatase YigB (HAD superfamily)
MTLTILFDLDDTLLNLNMLEFIPAYFGGLGQAFSNLGSPQQIADQVKFAVDKMVSNQDPSIGLHEIFSRHFYPPLGTTEGENAETLAKFYSKDYPKLQPVTKQVAGLFDLIDWCKLQDAQMAIATNPLFPETATYQRILWAGINLDDFEYFTTFDNFHFTKPNLSYYAECLGRLGWPEGHIVMVGDNLTHDLVPMESLGFPTFWINPPEESPARPYGELRDVKSWLAEIITQEPAPLNTTFDTNLAILRSTPAVLDSWIKENPEAAFKAKPSSDEWDITEVIWHMADMEAEAYLPQWQQLMKDTSVLLSAPDTSQWAVERHYETRSITEAWEKFVTARKLSLDCIVEIEQKTLLQTTVQHTVFSYAAVGELIAFAARHDRIHLNQCKNLLDFYKIY